MSRNSQVTRQWLLLEKLERSKGATLDELVACLGREFKTHSRTVRRDLEALETRFPLVTERRNGKRVWRLMDGYKRALQLTFSQTELMALVFSKDLLKPLDGTELKASLDSALQKMTAALPTEGASFLGNLRDFFSVGLGPHKKYREHRDTIETLTRAISRSRTVQMRYFSASRNATSRRDVDPYRLWYAQGALYLIGYCRRSHSGHHPHEPALPASSRLRRRRVRGERSGGDARGAHRGPPSLRPCRGSLKHERVRLRGPRRFAVSALERARPH
jgi:predicted DNA-binding transcriptional regulator YafY